MFHLCFYLTSVYLKVVVFAYILSGPYMNVRFYGDKCNNSIAFCFESLNLYLTINNVIFFPFLIDLVEFHG